MFTTQLLFPKTVLFGAKNLQSLNKTPEKKLFLVSKSFHEKNPDFFTGIVALEELILLTGEPNQGYIDIIAASVQKNNSGHIVAVGGGSVIDAAKIVKNNLKLQLTVVPTTIGSGSEVSQYSLLIDPLKKVKKVLKSGLPDTVIIDSELYKSLEKKDIVYQSIDALAHALESIVSRFSNNFSDMLALPAIESIFLELESLSDNPDSSTLEKIKIATTMAGIAQSSTGTGLVHSFAHYFGAQSGIPHAEAISIFLIPVLKLNMNKTEKYSKLNLLKTISAGNLITKLTEMYRKHAIVSRKITFSEDMTTAANTIRRDICTMSNPYSPGIDEISGILKSL